MPSEGRRLHRFTVVSRSLRLGRQLLLPAILGGASVGDGVGAVARWTLVILAIPSFAIAVAQWLAFRYRFEGGELIIDSGVLSRRRRVIPAGRIQNVDLRRSALERLAGVAELRIETASGGTDTEAGLAVLSLGEARDLRAELLRARGARTDEAGERVAGDTPGPPTEAAPQEAGWEGAGREHGFGDRVVGDRVAGGRVVGERVAGEQATEEEPLLRLSVTDLAIAGATSNEAGLIAAGLATAFEVLDDVAGVERMNAWLETAFQEGAGLGVTGVLLVSTLLVLGFVVLGWVVSIVATVVRFYGFTLTRAGDDLRREYGLFSRHHSTVPLERIQAVRIEETLLRRPLGLAALKIETAGFGPRQRQEAQGGAEAYVPITRRGDVARLVRAAFEDARFEDVTLHAVAPVSRRRSFIRLAVPIALATAVAAWLEPVGAAVAALLVPAWFIARAQYRARAWARPVAYAIVRGGVLTRTNWVIPERKIQTLHLKETPFQRRLGLATLMIDTAGGGSAAQAVDLHYDTAESVLLALARDAEDARRRAVAGA